MNPIRQERNIMKKKKLLSALLAVILVVASIPLYAFAADNPDADDNTKVVLQYTLAFTGSGTQDDPYYGELNYRSSKIDETTIETVNPLATINGASNTYTVSLHYGWNDIEFYVTSADGTKTSYYHVRWSRTKQSRTEHLKTGDLYTEPATDANTADGKIINFDADEVYEYTLDNANDWKAVSGVTEITGLAAGVYRVRYGESDSHQADSGSNYLKVYVGRMDQPFTTENASGYEIEMPDTVYAGERIDFKVKLDGESFQPIMKVNAESKLFFSNSTMYTSVTFVSYVTDYETGADGTRYAVGYFMLNGYNKNGANGTLTIKDITLYDANYYEIEKADSLVASTTVTPAKEEDTITFQNSTLYKEGSSVTISLEAKTSAGVEKINSFDVCLDDGTVVASSKDGSEITVIVSGNLHVANIDAVYQPADLTAMEEQLARLDGVDLTLYTDDTRVAVEERLALAEQMYKVLAKDQYLVDEFVPTLKAAIDSLVPKDGIFTGIEENQALIPMDGSLYTEESWNQLMQAAQAAQTAVDEQWNRLRQDEIDALAAELKAAIDALEYKPADYTAVDEAIANAEKLDPTEYKDFSAVEAAVNAVDRTKNITEQAEVDAMAQAINDAVAALEKAEKPQESADTGRDTSAKSPDTGAQLLVPAAGAMLVSAAAIVLLSKRRENG